MRSSDWSSDVCSSDLRNSGRFARAAAQIVKFRPAHHATANDIDALDVRRVEREHTLHTLAEGNLAHGEAGTETLVRTRDAHAFVVLDTGAFAFHDPHADAQRDRKSKRLNSSH